MKRIGGTNPLRQGQNQGFTQHCHTRSHMPIQSPLRQWFQFAWSLVAISRREELLVFMGVHKAFVLAKKTIAKPIIRNINRVLFCELPSNCSKVWLFLSRQNLEPLFDDFLKFRVIFAWELRRMRGHASSIQEQKFTRLRVCWSNRVS